MKNVIIIAIVMIVGVTGHVTARDRDDNQPRIIVGRDVATIQEAVDAIPDGGRVIVQSGRYEESVVITGKTIDLVGKGRPQLVHPIPEQVVDAASARGIITYSAGGGGRVGGFVFIGGDAAIKGFDRSAPPGGLVIRNSTIQGSGRGILWGFSDLEVNSLAITNTLWHGISTKLTTALAVLHTSISNSIGVGLFIFDTGFFTPAEILGGIFASNARGGIFAINSALVVNNSSFILNSLASIRVMGSLMTVNNSVTLGTLQEATTAQWGDGIIVMPWTSPSIVSLKNTLIQESARAGVSNFGSQIDIKNTLIRCAGFEITHQDVAEDLFGTDLPPMGILASGFGDLGGNLCGCPFADSNCSSSNAGLEPPQPTDATN